MGFDLQETSLRRDKTGTKDNNAQKNTCSIQKETKHYMKNFHMFKLIGSIIVYDWMIVISYETT